MDYINITLEQAYMLNGAYCDGDNKKIVFKIEKWKPLDCDCWVYRFIIR